MFKDEEKLCSHNVQVKFARRRIICVRSFNQDSFKNIRRLHRRPK